MVNAASEGIARRLGQLAKRRREEIGLNRAALAKEVGIEAEQAIVDLEFGASLPSADVQRKLEKALDWKPGVIEEVAQMTDRPADSLVMEDLDAEDSLYLAAQGGPSLTSAEDSELLAEVARRGL